MVSELFHFSGLKSSCPLIATTDMRIGFGPYALGFIRLPTLLAALVVILTVNGMFSNSDVRLKAGVTNLNYGLNEVLRLHTVSWTWKADSENRKQLGLIAQEVRPLLPELILEGTDKDHLLSMNYLGLLPIVIKAIFGANALSFTT